MHLEICFELGLIVFELQPVEVLAAKKFRSFRFIKIFCLRLSTRGFQIMIAAPLTHVHAKFQGSECHRGDAVIFQKKKVGHFRRISTLPPF